MEERLKRSVTQQVLDSLTRANLRDIDAEDRKKEIANAVALCEVLNAESKAVLEAELAEEKLNTEEKLKELELKQSRREMWLRIGITAAQVVIPLAFYGCWTRRMMKFEELGHVPSSFIFREFTKNVRPKM